MSRTVNLNIPRTAAEREARLIAARDEAIQRAVMQDTHTILTALLKQLDVADAYARDANRSPTPSVWQLQNSLLREKAREALSSATSMIT